MNRGLGEKNDQKKIAIIIVLGWTVNMIFFIVTFAVTKEPLFSFFIACFFAALISGVLYYWTQKK